MANVSTIYDEWMLSNDEDWSQDEHYLNYPGFLYSFYGKLKPMFKPDYDASTFENVIPPTDG